MSAPPINGVFVTAAAGACLAEVGLLFTLHTRAWSPFATLLGHSVVVGALLVWCVLPGHRRDLRLPMLLTLATAFFGPLGAAGTVVAALVSRIYARSATPFEEWYASLFPEVEGARRLPQLPNQDVGGRHSVAPFADILSFGQLSQKQELLTLIASDFRPEFAHVLHLALHDANNAIRVQAATAIARIEDQFSQRTLQLSADVQENPCDAERLWGLATLLDEYASAGIMDRERAAAARNRAVEAYLDYLQLVGKHQAAEQAVGRLRLGAGDHSGTARWLEQRGEVESVHPESRLIYMEALFELGRFDELRQYAAAHAPDLLLTDTLPLEARETTKLWAVAGA